MSKHLLRIALILILPNLSFAQTTISHSGGAGKGSTQGNNPSSGNNQNIMNTGSQSGASQIEQGYNYLLPSLSFIKYNYKDTTVEKTTKSLQPTQVILITIVKRYIINPGNSSKPREYPKGAQVVLRSNIISMTCVKYDPSYLIVKDCKDSLYIDSVITTIQIDTLDRFFKKCQRISITQADSGKLTLGFKKDYISGARGNPIQKEEEQHAMELISTNYSDKIIYTNDSADYIYKKKYSEDTLDHYALLLGPTDRIAGLSLQIHPKLQFKDITYYIKSHYLVFQTGALTIPYKYHFNYLQHLPNGGGRDTIPNDLSVNINVSLAAGLRFGGTRFYYDQSKTVNTLAGFIGTFVGPTQIQLSNTNTFSQTSKTSNQLGVSWGICSMLELKNFNFGAFAGIDFPVSKAGTDWFYSNRIWLGFGVGINLAMLNVATHQSL